MTEKEIREKWERLNPEERNKWICERFDWLPKGQYAWDITKGDNKGDLWKLALGIIGFYWDPIVTIRQVKNKGLEVCIKSYERKLGGKWVEICVQGEHVSDPADAVCLAALIALERTT